MRGARRPPNAVLGTTTRSGRPHKTRPRAVPAGAAAGSSRGEAPEAPDDPTLGRNPSEPRHGRRPLPEAAGGPARAGPPATTDPAAGPSDARLHWYSTRSRRPRSSRTAQRRHDAGTRRRREPPRRVRGSDLGPAGARAQRAARARRRLRSRQPSSRQGRGMLAEGIPEQRSYDRRSAGLTWRASAPRDRQRPAAAPPGTREPPARAARPVRAIAHPTERCERPPAPPASPDQRTAPPGTRNNSMAPHPLGPRPDPSAIRTRPLRRARGAPLATRLRRTDAVRPRTHRRTPAPLIGGTSRGRHRKERSPQADPPPRNRPAGTASTRPLPEYRIPPSNAITPPRHADSGAPSTRPSPHRLARAASGIRNGRSPRRSPCNGEKPHASGRRSGKARELR